MFKAISSCWLCLIVVAIVEGAPRTRLKDLPQTVIDQKQTGDNNIHIRLKDFQIIGIFGDDSLGSLGDYDYNYDYTDFTVKPPANLTQKPLTEASPTTSTFISSSSSSAASSTSQELSAPAISSEKPSALVEISSTTASNLESKTTKTSPLSSDNSHTEKLGEISSSTEKLLNTSNPPDKIKVQILQSPMIGPNVAIVPVDDVSSANENPPLGEMMHYRRCLSGYARDKKGRCKRIRRPGGHQLSFDFSRLASNLASRLRHTSSSSSSASSDSSLSSLEALGEQF